MAHWKEPSASVFEGIGGRKTGVGGGTCFSRPVTTEGQRPLPLCWGVVPRHIGVSFKIPPGEKIECSSSPKLSAFSLT